ncbi:MAG: C39 family peptidase [candidate division WOR-3 bacterium]
MKIYFILKLVLLLIFVNLPNFTFAQTQINQAIQFLQYYCGPGGSINYCLQGIYNLIVALAVVVAFIMFILGAFKNLLSTIPDVKMEGKKQMINAIIGLVVIFSSGVLLYWVNPQIFNAKLIMFRVDFTNPTVLLEIGQGTEQSGLPEIEGEGANPKTSGIQHGKPLIKQNDPAWAYIPYRNPTCGNENQTIGSSGCGIASLAMAIAYYNNYSKDKYYSLITTLAKDAVNNGFRTCNNGTAWKLFTSSYLKEKWGVSGRLIGKNIEEAKKALSNNKIVIAAMSGPSPFTRRGHYITLVGFELGKFLINDPGPKDVKEASEDIFKQFVKAMWVIEK